MISRVRLNNFKLHADTTLEMRPLTVFIGPNNSGKSSVFQALLALKQAANHPRGNLCAPPVPEHNRGVRPYQFASHQLVDVGQFSDVVRHGFAQIILKVEGSLTGMINVALRLEFAIQDNLLHQHSGVLDAGSHQGKWSYSRGRPAVPFRFPSPPSTILLECVPDFRLIQLGSVDHPPTLDVSDEARVGDLARWLGSSPATLLNTVHHVYPLRGFEEGGYQLPDNPEDSVEQMTLADRALATVSILAYRPEIEEQLSDWLEGLLGLRVRHRLVPAKRVILWCVPSGKSRNGKETLLSNEGTGANQIPFILIPIGLAPPQDTILLSEPEAHLHPRAQSQLARLLLKIRQDEGRQFVIETHSEHILYAFLHAIASGQLARQDLVIYYFENDGGTAKVRALEMDEYGRVRGGLPGFFDHGLDELATYLDAFAKAKP